MTRDLVFEGSAIEGAKVSASARRPIKQMGAQLLRPGVRCNLYSVSFDVVANITQPLPEGANLLVVGADLDLDAEIKCDKANIYSFDRIVRARIGARTGTHQASFWEFAKQTAVKIDRGHESLKNGIAKAKALEAGTHELTR